MTYAPPYAPANDVQQGIVYGFERDRIEPYAPAVMDKEEIVDLVMRSCRLARIRAPKVKHGGDHSFDCLANIKEWTIEIQDWGRNPTTVLHEVAHLVTYEDPEGRAEMMRGQAHGSVFVRHAIDLYSDFINIPREVLEESARGFGLRIAPSRLKSIESGESFYEGEF